MAPKTAATSINTQIYAEAAQWLVENREHLLDEAAKKSFDLWLRTSPEHIRAYLELSALWEDLSLLDPDANSTSAESLARTSTNDNIVTLQPCVDTSRRCARNISERGFSQQHTITSRPWQRVGVAASVILLLAATALLAWTTRDPGYSTDIGEQRTIHLPDGSTVELNSASRVNIHYTKQHRSVELVRGQALFQVAKERSRPFVVSAGGARVRAVGTQFDVYQKRAATVVTVLEGQVAILPQAAARDNPSQPMQPSREPSQARPPILLSAGQQLTVTHDEVKETSKADLATATAWTQHHIVFTDSPLNEVVEEFNRYNTRHLIISDPRLDNFRINGVFSSADPAVLLRFLQQQGDIEVEETDTAIRISHR